MIKFEQNNIIQLRDWDNLVKETYGKPYSFQQQDGCQEKGLIDFEVPNEEAVYEEEEMNDKIPLVVNGDVMGVKFELWINTNPITHKEKKKWEDYQVELFWQRNFYPNFYVIANDLYEKGLIPKGKYFINISW